jgi:regulator of chromosome condensation
MEPRRSARAASAKPQSTPAEPKVKPRSRSAAPKRKAAASPERSPSPPPKRTKAAPAPAEKKTRAKATTDDEEPVVERSSRSRTSATNGVKAANGTKTANGTKAATVVRAKSASKERQPRSRAASVEKKTNGVTKTRSKLSPVREKAEAAPLVQKEPYFNPLPTPPEHTQPGLQLFVWGTGNFGQFGLGTSALAEISKPRKNAWVEEKIKESAFGENEAGLEAIRGGGLHSLFIDGNGVVWSCGVNDDAALGRYTTDVPDPDKPGSFLDVDELTAVPHPIQSLVDQKFRAVRLTAGDTISAALSAEGDLRIWGTFRVSFRYPVTIVSNLNILGKRRFSWILKWTEASVRSRPYSHITLQTRRLRKGCWYSIRQQPHCRPYYTRKSLHVGCG